MTLRRSLTWFIVAVFVAACGNADDDGATPPACPTAEVRMADPCQPPAQKCTYTNSFETCRSTYTCDDGRWGPAKTSSTGGSCDRLWSCPAVEPSPLEPYPGVAPFVPSGCRYAHGACFTYWRVRSSQAPDRLYVSELTRDDGCCAATAPPEGASCDGDGAVCTYDATIATCSGGKWTLK